MPQPELIVGEHPAGLDGGDDRFGAGGPQEVQAHFGGRLFRSLFQPGDPRGAGISSRGLAAGAGRTGLHRACPQAIFELAGDDDAIALDRMARKLACARDVRQRRAGGVAPPMANLSPWRCWPSWQSLFQAVPRRRALCPSAVVLEVADHGFFEGLRQPCPPSPAGAGATGSPSTISGISPATSSAPEALAPTSWLSDRCLIGRRSPGFRPGQANWSRRSPTPRHSAGQPVHREPAAAAGGDGADGADIFQAISSGARVRSVPCPSAMPQRRHRLRDVGLRAR